MSPLLAIEKKDGYQVIDRVVTAKVCSSTESAYLLLDCLDLITGKCCEFAIAQVIGVKRSVLGIVSAMAW